MATDPLHLRTKPPPASSFPGEYNYRDVGGLVTETGGVVARGRLFRAAEPWSLTAPAAASFLGTCGATMVVDLRTHDELAYRAVAALPESCERLHLPLFATIRPHWANPPERHPAITGRMYLEMLEEGRSTLARIMMLLASDHAPRTLIHCVAGRDRTGIVIACILQLLDVAEDVIVTDYALSAVVDRYGYNADPENMVQFLSAVRKEHGSVREMMRTAGVGDATIAGLRRNLLEG